MDDDAIPLSGGSPSAGWEDTLIVLGVILAVTVAALFWAVVVYQRKLPHRRRRHHHHHHKTGYGEGLRKGAGGLKQLIEKRRRHRRERRPLNPTLAETGGLPPVRGGEPPEPPNP